ncbi:heterodisulfide reductase [bacterium (candidate division B38) B3_B38]|nr:MAG: heterodisulfide reductase [bacterium (candidate division B38) B3_B38]
MLDVGRHPNIELLTLCQLTKVEGEKGNFRVSYLKKARYVKEDVCTACGICAEKCPIKVPDDFELGLGKRKAVYIYCSQGVPSVYAIDPEHCPMILKGKCGLCDKLCQAGAIDYNQRDEEKTINVGAIVVATGFSQLKPTALKNYGYRQYANVLTGLEFERLLSATGPTGGHILRPSDSKAPQKIVFIQCVGSRMTKENGYPYCSVYCCTNSIKCALLAKTHDANIKDISILYMDLRTYGKGFQELFLRAKEVEGVKFLRGRPARVLENPETKSLTIMVENTDNNRIEPLEADMVVLSTAAIPSKGAEELARILGIEVDSYGFFKERDFHHPTEATRPGVYIAGSCSGPRDITDSVAWGTATAVKALTHMEGARIAKKEIDVEPIDISGEPRIGVFVCHCGINIAGVVDVEEVNQYAQTLPGVVYSERMLFACADDSQREIQDKIKEYQLNRVVVASCTPRTHEPIFRETCDLVGLNPYLFEMANIRDQCSWVHASNPKKATEKANDLVRMAVARCHLLQPLESRQMPMNPDMLVVGGGITGIQASLDLARLGHKVTLVEKEDRLGGRVKELATFYEENYDGEQLISEKVKQLEKAGVNILTSTMVNEVSGFVGNFEVSLQSLKQKEETTTIQLGSIVVAIGSDLYDPTGKFGYGSFPNILTNMEMEKLLREGSSELTPDGKEAKNIVFVQCVGSRNKEEGNPDCSRYCCLVAIKQALKLREKGARVVILYRDIIAFGKGGEELYRKARGEGVLFLRYDAENPPQVIGKGRATGIRWMFSPLSQEIELPVDLVVLSVGMVPRKVDAEQIQEQLKIPRSLDGFFMERHSKLGPVETSTEGIYICGCAQSAKDITDSVAQASAAASKAAVMASKEFVELEPTTCVVREELCRGCGTCQEVCQFNAPELVETPAGYYVSRINEALCKGCGTCASLCPTGAIVARHFTDLQIDKMVEAMLASSL